MRRRLYLIVALTVTAALLTGCAGTPVVEADLEKGRRAAEDFVRGSPTFAFDGIEDSLRLADTLEISQPASWTFVFEYDASHAGYGDRAGQVLAQVITPHTASVTVTDGEVVYGTLDNKWDMLEQTEQFGVDPDSAVTPEADFTGWVTAVETVGRNGVFGIVHAESQVEKVVDKYAITVTEGTAIVGLDGGVVGFDALRETQQVLVWFSGPVKESFPMQVDAGRIVIGQAGRGNVTARLGDEMSLPIGQTAVVSGEGLTIEFRSVPEDSRCARDVTCVWAGQVRCAVDVTANGDTTSLDLIQPGLTDAPASQEHGGYVFTFSVDPYPEEAGLGIAPGDYVLRLTVNR